MLITEDRVWAGSEASLQAVMDADEAIQARLKAGTWDNDEDEDEPSRLLQVQDGVGVLNITGSLVNSDSWWNRLFGVTGYPEIQSALVEAAYNPEIKQVLLNIDSGGGSVSGVEETAELIRTIHNRVKPVVAHTSGNMYSAAMWLGASAGEVYAAKSAGVGSVGVIATHVEKSEAMKQAGYKPTVIRAGKYKALANSVEPLSEEGRKQIQAQVDAAYGVFVDHIAAMRGKSYEYTDQTMAQGREFTAQNATDVGLIDGIKGFNALMSELKEKSIASSKNLIDTRGNAGRGFGASLEPAKHGEQDMAKKQALTEQDIAALAAGANLEATVSEAEVKAEVEGAADAAAAVEGAEAEAGASEGAAVVAEVAKNDDALRLLKEQLKAAQDDLLEAKIEGRKAADKLAEVEAIVNPLKEIAAKAANNMRVALGGSVLDMSAMSAAQVLADHQAVAGNFVQKFKVGGVAAVDAAQEEKKTVVDPLHLARVAAVR